MERAVGDEASPDSNGADPTMSVIDVGAGASRLAAALLRRGFADVTALDVAEDGLAVARTELGPDAGRITWVTADLLTWSPPRRFDIWHDRAVFHFLASPRSSSSAPSAPPGPPCIRAGSSLSRPPPPTGPSSVPVCRPRYSPARLVDTFNIHSGAAFELLDQRREEHRTPSGAVQPFTWVALARREAT